MDNARPSTFAILGPLQVLGPDGRALRLARRERHALAALLINANRSVSAGTLATAIWHEQPSTARRQIQNCLAQLRRSLPEIVTHGNDGYRIVAGEQDLDSLRFEAAVGRARALRDRARTADAVACYHDALSLWRGPALADCSGPFFEPAAARLDELRLAAAEDRLTLELELGPPQELIPELTALVAENPLREPLVAALMRALYRTGRQVDALAAYTRLRERTGEELGVEPGVEVRQLHRAMLRGEVMGAPASPPRTPAEVVTRVPRQLPAASRAFVGRAAELAELDRLAQSATIVVVDGPGGIGKSTLALHWAHGVSERFPHGQLYVNLRGFDPSGTPVPAAEALGGLLEAFGVPRDVVPVAAQAQTGLYRSLLAGRRVLIVLDNAADADQVRPLLPGTPTCQMVVTSRRRLTGLAATNGARLVTLSPLSPQESYALLAGHIGEERLAVHPAAASALVAAATGLPLAVAILGARASAHPGPSLDTVVAGLVEADPPLDAFDADDPMAGLRSVFSWSYRLLSPDAARLFRLLGVHPGPDLTVAAAASLAGAAPEVARDGLAELAGLHLVAEPAPGRFTLHDLLREHARELAATVDAEPDRVAAARRVFDHYTHTGVNAAVLLEPQRPDVEVEPPAAGAVPERLGTAREATAWLTAEYQVLLRLLDLSTSDSHTTAIAWVLSGVADRTGRWADLERMSGAALLAAKRRGDLAGQAFAHRGIARAYAQTGRPEEATARLLAALTAYQQAGDLTGQAFVHLGLGTLLSRRGGHAEAMRHIRKAHEFAEAAGQTSGVAYALNGIGWCLAQLGDYAQALTACEQSVRLFEDIGDSHGEAMAADSLAFVQARLGRPAEAAQSYRRAIAIGEQLSSHFFVAVCRSHLGDLHAAQGDGVAAAALWQASLDVLGELRHPLADGVRERLNRPLNSSAGYLRSR